MIRKEQIEAAAKEYANRNYSAMVQVMSHGNSFLEGAEWADKTPSQEWIDNVYRSKLNKLQARLDIAVDALEHLSTCHYDNRGFPCTTENKYIEDCLAKIKGME